MRNTSRFLFIGTLAATGHIACAQYTIDLGEEHLGVPGFGVQVDSVVVAFDDLAPLGWVRRGLANGLERAYLKGSVKAQVVDLLRRDRLMEPAPEHITLKLNALHLTEYEVRGHEVAYCGINIEFISGQGGGMVREYKHGATVWDKGDDVTGKHAHNIAVAIEQCIRGYREARERKGTTHVPVTLADLYRQTDPMVPPPHIFTHAPPAGGIYNSFMDLLNEHPDISHNYSLEDAKDPDHGVRGVRLKSDVHDLGRSAWGMSDGTQLYVNVGDRFMPLLRDAKGWHLDELIDIQQQRDARLGKVMAYSMFGLIGGAIINSASGPNGVPDRPHYDLDLLTGMLLPGRAPSDSVSSPPHQRILFLYSPSSKRDTVIHASVNGGGGIALRRGKYCRVRVVPRADGVPAEVMVDSAHRTEVSLETNVRGTQVYVITVGKKNELSVFHPLSDQADEIIDGLKPEDEVK